MNIGQYTNRKGDKVYYYYDLGRGPGQRPKTGVFTYVNPKNQEQKNFNKEALKILEVKKSQFIIEEQAIGSPVIPSHKFKTNFLDYYEEYMNLNKRDGNRHLSCCFSKLKKFIKGDYLPPIDVTENFCKRFRRYLLDELTGETPANYFARFKWVIQAATSDGYFRKDPTSEVAAVGNPSIALKQNLEVKEYISLLQTPCFNQEIKDAFIFCCYAGLRWVDVKLMTFADLIGNQLITRIIQKKTGQPVVITLHPIAKAIIEKKKAEAGSDLNRPVFLLPSANGANKILKEWVKKAGIAKHITWSCARLSFSILLQDKNVDTATVAYLLGHTTTRQVERVYKRHRPKDQVAAISNLPQYNVAAYY